MLRCASLCFAVLRRTGSPEDVIKSRRQPPCVKYVCKPEANAYRRLPAPPELPPAAEHQDGVLVLPDGSRRIQVGLDWEPGPG